MDERGEEVLYVCKVLYEKEYRSQEVMRLLNGLDIFKISQDFQE